MNAQTLWKLLATDSQDTPKNRKAVQTLIDTYSCILNNEFDDKDNILCNAARCNYIMIAEILIQSKKVNLDKQISTGSTALILSIVYNCPDIAIMLLKAGANAAIVNGSLSDFSYYLTQIDDLEKREQIKKWIPSSAQTIVSEITEQKITVDQLWNILKVYKDDNINLKELLNLHADVIHDKTKGYTSLLFAAIGENECFIAAALVNAKVDINKKTKNAHHNALTYAMELNRSDIVILLLESGADFTCFNNKGKTAADYINYITPVSVRKQIEEIISSKRGELRYQRQEELKLENQKIEAQRQELQKQKAEKVEKQKTEKSETSETISITSNLQIIPDDKYVALVKYLRDNDIDFAAIKNQIIIGRPVQTDSL